MKPKKKMLAVKGNKPKRPPLPSPSKIDEVAALFLTTKEAAAEASAKNEEARLSALAIAAEFPEQNDSRICRGEEYEIKAQTVRSKPEIDQTALRAMLKEKKLNAWIPKLFTTETREVTTFNEDALVAAIESGKLPLDLVRQCTLPGGNRGTRLYVSAINKKGNNE